MRRKRADSQMLTKDGVSPEALRPCPPLDSSLSIAQQTAVLDEWVAERSAWVERRQLYALRRGWSGDEFARSEEERLSHPYPDYPFDLDEI